MQPTDIVTVTGHRNVASLSSYASEPTERERASMSTILAKYGQSEGSKESKDLCPVKKPKVIVDIPITTSPISLTHSMSQALDYSTAVFAGVCFQGPVTINVNIEK